MINLLPWRENLRKKQKQRFLIALITASSAIITIIIIWHLFLTHQLNKHKSHTHHLNNQIAQLNKKHKTIKILQQNNKTLSNRIQTIETIKIKQEQIIYALKDLATKIPASIYLTEISKKEDAITLVGVAKTHQDITTFVKNLDHSKCLTQPKLQEITTKKNIRFILRGGIYRSIHE